MLEAIEGAHEHEAVEWQSVLVFCFFLAGAHGPLVLLCGSRHGDGEGLFRKEEWSGGCKSAVDGETKRFLRELGSAKSFKLGQCAPLTSLSRL